MSGAAHHHDIAAEDQLRTMELAEMLGFVADFLAQAEDARLRRDLAELTCGSYELAELRGDLRRFAGWLMGEGFE
jgi:hypothetical protein